MSKSVKRLLAVVVIGAIAAVTVLGGWLQWMETPQDALAPKGPFSRISYDLIVPVFGIAAFVFVAVEGLILFTIFKYTRKHDDERPEQVHGNTAFEIAWTIIPAVILAFIGFFTVRAVFELDRIQTSDVNVEVIGHQWWWEYRYLERQPTDTNGNGHIDVDDVAKIPETVHTANELHIPAGRTVNLWLTSADVVHSYWPPKLAGKLDTVPGQMNHMSIQADQPGVYFGQCAEYCGYSHANMRLRIMAGPKDQYDKWLQANDVKRTVPPRKEIPAADLKDAPLADQGAQLFVQKGCSGCHTVNGVSAGTLGPNLTNFNGRATFAGAIYPNDDRSLRQWLQDPPKAKPGSTMPKLNLTEPETNALVAYLRTLGDESTRGATNESNGG